MKIFLKKVKTTNVVNLYIEKCNTLNWRRARLSDNRPLEQSLVSLVDENNVFYSCISTLIQFIIV